MAATFPETSLSTERIVLRPFEEEDVPALVDMMNDELVRAWTSVPAPYTEAHARDWVTRGAPAERTEGRGIVFAVAEHLTGRLVGTVHLSHTDWRCRNTEVSYVTASWARGEGYAPEAVLAVAHWLFEEQGFERLELRTAAGNTASQQVAQKIGCISEGVLRSAWPLRGQESADGPAGEDGASGASGPGLRRACSGPRTDLIVWSLLPEDLEGVTRTGASVGCATGGEWP
ncbi:GNAT family N-acetyltransferase [Streptomyces capparidis]